MYGDTKRRNVHLENQERYGVEKKNKYGLWERILS
jgi:hypothetical protein